MFWPDYETAPRPGNRLSLNIQPTRPAVSFPQRGGDSNHIFLLVSRDAAGTNHAKYVLGRH